MTGVCAHCGRVRWLDATGRRLAVHYLRNSGTAYRPWAPAGTRVHRKCRGSGLPPRPERGPR